MGRRRGSRRAEQARSRPQAEAGYLRVLRSKLRPTPEAARPSARSARNRRVEGLFFRAAAVK